MAGPWHGVETLGYGVFSVNFRFLEFFSPMRRVDAQREGLGCAGPVR
jgi:hypothetical protein